MHRIFREHFSRKPRSSGSRNDSSQSNCFTSSNQTVERELEALRAILHSTQPRLHRDLPGHQHLQSSHGFHFGKRFNRNASGIDCDEVYPGLFIGNKLRFEFKKLFSSNLLAF